jgi:hypothetical protein
VILNLGLEARKHIQNHLNCGLPYFVDFVRKSAAAKISGIYFDPDTLDIARSTYKEQEKQRKAKKKMNSRTSYDVLFSLITNI